ncbi:MAG TPA: amidohydrolase family protein [Acidimicrobiales bacterium]|jgi:predicted TIM-barrel fold metal-dependent hydrolase|nr:amidohydrolase family protein [Acidimicrobiales bacterium]
MLIDHVQDIDSHEMIPTHLMEANFGDVGAKVAKMLESRGVDPTLDPNSPTDPGAQDVLPIGNEEVWTVKGVRAPGAIDMNRRLAVLDQMGIKSQLVFPTFGLAGFVIGSSPKEQFEFWFGSSEDDRVELGRAVINAANDWCIRQGAVDAERIRVVAIVPSDEIGEMIRESGDLIDRGARAIWISASNPPGGRSPASPEMDEFWAHAAARNVPVLFHIGTELTFLSDLWRAGTNIVTRHHSLEAPKINEYTMSIVHYAVENYLTIMILGGVFERHPSLRIGVTECTASWIGPMARRLDMMVTALHGGEDLTLKPSDYLRRNVRVSPFAFEPVDEYLRAYPDLVDIYTYASDYPHIEGGRHSVDRFHEKIAPLGDDVVEKFFRTNGDLLLPSR